MPKTKRMLTEAEAKILEVLWDRPGQTMMEITRALAEDTAWSKHTVTTLLKRMIEKETVAMDDSGPVRRYSPAIGREAVMRLETRSLLDRLFSGNASLLVNNLVESGELSRADVEALLKTLDGAKEE
ncbi:MAG: BlaI/MecI/CopY family transcriptional regulator [Christensenellaceae bacterium]|nr:BlaI/MecI/CopY family transcriptional regulator [Christensenellaceae bacterium]